MAELVQWISLLGNALGPYRGGQEFDFLYTCASLIPFDGHESIILTKLIYSFLLLGFEILESKIQNALCNPNKKKIKK